MERQYQKMNSSKLVNIQTEEFNQGYDSPRRRQMGSEERQLFNLFEELGIESFILDDVETEELNKIAKIVLERITDKLQGTDFQKNIQLDIKSQVEKLIKQATSSENLAQSYIGWCPYW